MARLAGISRNMNAFLDMIAYSEGTTRVHGSDDGYNVEFGCDLFHDYSQHPMRVHTEGPLVSTAAGRYQLLAKYWGSYRKLLGLTDFGPESQDRVAIQQIKECRALSAVEAGEVGVAIRLCAHIWASLPGAGYGQHENKLAVLAAKYEAMGGSFPPADS